MARRAVDRIPGNILAAARQAGLSTPLWYVGRTKGQGRCRQKTLADLAAEGRDAREPEADEEEAA